MGDLEKRFETFVTGLEGTECIDKLLLTRGQLSSEKADYFLNNRQIICELKSLKSDTKGKIDRILMPHQARSEWPLFYGEWEISKILKHLPDGDQINKYIVEAISTSIDELFRKANRQIRRTKEMFHLPKAGGVLIILNELVDILSPEILAYKIKELYGKRTPERKLQFSEINFTWIINETHYTQLNSGLRGIPMLGIPNNIPDECCVAEFIESILPQWATHNGIPLIVSDWDSCQKLGFKSTRDRRNQNQQGMKRHELWRMQYRDHPYLKSLSKENLIAYAQRLFSDSAPGILKGASKEEYDLSFALLEPFTHLLEEVGRRGMDMKEFSPMFRDVGEKVNAELRGKKEQNTKVKVGRNDPCPCAVGKNIRNAAALIRKKGNLVSALVISCGHFGCRHCIRFRLFYTEFFGSALPQSLVRISSEWRMTVPNRSFQPQLLESLS